MILVRSTGQLEAKELAAANTLQEMILGLFEILKLTHLQDLFFKPVLEQD